MPNTPCLIGQAASAYVLGTHATSDDNDKVFALMSSVGAHFAQRYSCNILLVVVICIPAFSSRHTTALHVLLLIIAPQEMMWAPNLIHKPPLLPQAFMFHFFAAYLNTASGFTLSLPSLMNSATDIPHFQASTHSCAPPCLQAWHSK